MPEKGRVFTGARARFSIDGRKVGYATNVSGSEEYQYDPVEVLDNIEVEEFAPTAYRVTFNASLVRIVGETVKSEGFFPQGGTSPEERLQNVLLQDDLVATIEDSKTGKVICTVEQMKMSSRNFTVNSRGIVGKDVTFAAVRMRDESEV
jgi:hypothetical protein